jgi:hypothetical protein
LNRTATGSLRQAASTAQAPVHLLGGELKAFWSCDHDDEEWSEDYRLGELDVT